MPTLRGQNVQTGAGNFMFLQSGAPVFDSLTVTQSLLVEGISTLENVDISGVISLPGAGNAIGSAGSNVAISSDANIVLDPGVTSQVTVTRPIASQSYLEAGYGTGANNAQIAGSGTATIPQGTTLVTVPFNGMTMNGRIIATITGNFNGAGALSVVPSINEFYIYSQNAVSAATNVFWLVVHY